MSLNTDREARKPAPRTRSNFPVTFRRRYSRQEETGFLKNISESGAFLSQKEAPLEVGSKVQLILDFGGLKREINARVVWTGAVGSGIEFITHLQKDRIIVQDFIEHLNEQKSSKYKTLELIFKKVG